MNILAQLSLASLLEIVAPTAHFPLSVLLGVSFENFVDRVTGIVIPNMPYQHAMRACSLNSDWVLGQYRQMKMPIKPTHKLMHRVIYSCLLMTTGLYWELPEMFWTNKFPDITRT
jgi:hypothetical protein